MIVERLQVLLDANAKQMVAAFGEAGAAADVAALKQGKLTAAQKLWAGAQANMGKIAAAGAVVAGLAITKFALDGTKAFVDLTGQIKQFQRVTGATAQDASRMVGIMHDLGIESAAGTKAMGMFAKNIGAGKINLDEYGISLAKNANGTVDLTGTLAKLSEKFVTTKDATERAALGQAAFGRGWQTLLPLLLKGRDGIKEMTDQLQKAGLVFDQSGVEQGRKAALAMRELDTAVLGLKIQLGRGLVPVISDIANALRDTINAVNDLTAPLGGLSGTIHTLFEIGKRVNPITGPFFLAKDAVNALSDAFDGDNATVEEVIAKFEGLRAKQDIVSTGFNQLSAAERNWASATAESGNLTDKQTQAIYNNVAAQLAAQGSLLGVESAQNAYNDAVQKSGVFSLEARTAYNNMEVATLRAAQANRTNTATLFDLRNQLDPRSPLRGVLDGYINQVFSLDRRVITRLELQIGGQNVRMVNGAMQVNFGMGWVTVGAQHAKGGVFNSPHMGMIGEAGPEAIVPLSQPGRAAQVLAEAGLLGGSGGGSYSPTFNINVSALPGNEAEAGRAVVEKIKQYEQRHGQAWRN